MVLKLITMAGYFRPHLERPLANNIGFQRPAPNNLPIGAPTSGDLPFLKAIANSILRNFMYYKQGWTCLDVGLSDALCNHTQDMS